MRPASQDPPGITFAIPFYSGLDYLRRAIDSVFRQTDPNWRVVVCDDSETWPVVEKLVAGWNDSRLRYLRNESRLGMAGNWNRCLDSASTDLVTILHADDELLPDYADTMTGAALLRPEAVAFFCQARIIGPDSRPVFSLPDHVKRYLIPSLREPVALCGEEGLRRLLRGNFIMCPTLCYRRSLLGRRFALDRRMVPDLELTTGLLLDGATLVGLPEVAYAYRRHENNQTNVLTASLVRFEEEAALYRELAEACRARGWSRAAAVARRKTIIRLNLLFCVVRDLLACRPGRAREKFRYLWSL